ncbi:unnamed protein product [Sphagnum balticum]
MRQGRRCHAASTYDCAGFCHSSKHTPQRGATQVRNKRRLSGRIVKAQGPNKDQIRPGRGSHAHTIGMQIGVVGTIQRGQGGKQAHLLVRSRTLRRQHLDLPTLLHLGA